MKADSPEGQALLAKFPWYKPREDEELLSEEDLLECEKYAEPNTTCPKCGGPGMLQYGIAFGGPGAYIVCYTETCDAITVISKDRDSDGPLSDGPLPVGGGGPPGGRQERDPPQR